MREFPKHVKVGDWIVPSDTLRMQKLLPDRVQVAERVHQVVAVLDQNGTRTIATLGRFKGFASHPTQ